MVDTNFTLLCTVTQHDIKLCSSVQFCHTCTLLEYFHILLLLLKYISAENIALFTQRHISDNLSYFEDPE